MSAIVRAPKPPGGPWVAIADDATWRVEDGTRTCRARLGRVSCGQPGAAALNRQRYISGKGWADSWWAYCPTHLAESYRWVQDGRVWRWRREP